MSKNYEEKGELKIKKGKFGIVLAIILTASIAVAINFMSKIGRAQIMTGPPGPYYITAEAMIIGPKVDLALIESKTGGTISQDHVQWGTNPFYRVYVDNTLQEVYYGQLIDVMDQFSWNFAIENNLMNAYNTLINEGALDPTSILSEFSYSGNIPGVFVGFFTAEPGTFVFNTTTTLLHVVEAHVATVWGWSSTWSQLLLNLNGGQHILLEVTQWPSDLKTLNSSSAAGTLCWSVTASDNWPYGDLVGAGITIYLKDLVALETATPANLRVYEVIDSPGTGFALKKTVPATPIANSVMDVIVTVDPPKANAISITDSFPSDFTLMDNKVVITRYSGVSAPESMEVIVTPSPTGFTVDYTQASILASLSSIHWFTVEYKLKVPATPGTYTLPEATITYEVPP